MGENWLGFKSSKEVETMKSHRSEMAFFRWRKERIRRSNLSNTPQYQKKTLEYLLHKKVLAPRIN